MPDDTPKTCQVEMHDDKPCGRPATYGDKCVCHTGRENKDTKVFQSELDKIFADEETEYYDLSRFIFPKKGYKLPKQYKKDTYFSWTAFSGRADFSFAEFSGKAYFHRATFSGEAEFLNATFSGEAKFRWSRFSGVAQFRLATFSGETSFYNTQFVDVASFSYCQTDKAARVTFDGIVSEKDKREVFPSGADFRWCSFAEPKNIKFRKLSLAECDFLDTDVTEMQFVDVTWARKPKFLKWVPRNAVSDEFAMQPDYNLVSQLYRRLQANYINNYRYAEAGDFHIGELEMMRKAKRKEPLYVLSNSLYKIISFYGESFTLPLLWLAFVLLFVPAVLLWDGINLNPTLQDQAVVETVNYEWSWSPGDFLPAKSDYWEAFVANLSLIAYSRSDIGKYLPESHTRFIVTIESLVVIALLAFFLLALRRQYKRKGF
ncbi:MAG: pentapeptide repeat-containing protein [bacterium]